MIKCTDKGKWTCIAKSGKPKKAFLNQDKAIDFAKWANKKFPQRNQKQVAYKCTHCHQYHLLTVSIKPKL